MWTRPPAPSFSGVCRLERLAMSKINVKNGTPLGCRSLCSTCDHAHVVNGYRESEMLVFCNYVYEQAILVPFKVRECSSYRDKNKPDWEQMEKFAIVLDPEKSLGPLGFRYEDDDELETISASTSTDVK